MSPSQIGEYLHYTIRLENTGSAAAENIIVATTINANDFDLSTLQVLNASHSIYARMTGNKVEFIFKNIQLTGSPSGGHEHVFMKMKSKNTLQTNDTVKNNANILFDYNFLSKLMMQKPPLLL